MGGGLECGRSSSGLGLMLCPVVVQSQIWLLFKEDCIVSQGICKDCVSLVPYLDLLYSNVNVWLQSSDFIHGGFTRARTAAESDR